MYRLSFLSSGTGNLTETILHAIKKGVLKNIIPVNIISDRDSASLKLASSFSTTAHIVNFSASTSREQSSNKLLEIFQNEKIDFSFMTFDRILSGDIISRYKNKIINIHPSLLPAFPGYDTINQAEKYGSKYIGATCHFIDEKADHGPIINQALLPFNNQEDHALVKQKLYRLRQQLALESLHAFSNNLITVNKREVFIKGANYNSYPINPSLEIPAINDFLNSYDS